MDGFLVNKRIDLVEFDGLKLFMFEDDQSYHVLVPEQDKHQDLEAYQRVLASGGVPACPVTPANVNQISSARYGVFVAMNHLWEKGVAFDVLDVGSHIGDFGLKVGNFIRAFGKPAKVVTFDPSEPGALVPYNIELNRLEGIVKHEALAVSDLQGFLLFQYRPGHSEGGQVAIANKSATGLAALWLNRIRQLPLHRQPAAYVALAFSALKRLFRSGKVADSYTLIARSVDIVDYARRNHPNRDVFVKIDIEGHDPVVINRLMHLLPERKIHIIFEFAPIRFTNHQEAVDYLQKLSSDFHIFDLYYCPNPTRFTRVTPEGLNGLVQDVRGRPHGYTDLFLLDKRTPGCEELMTRLSGLTRQPDELIL